jgi:hypothetical protein
VNDVTQDDPNHDLPGDVLLSANTINGDPDPIFDDCGAPDWAGFAPSGSSDNHNVGDLLNAKGVTWGWFQGGFAPTATVNGVAQCNATTTGHPGILGNPTDPIHAPIQAYVPHHNPFMSKEAVTYSPSCSLRALARSTSSISRCRASFGNRSRRPQDRVRSRLCAGGKRIRTSGSAPAVPPEERFGPGMAWRLFSREGKRPGPPVIQSISSKTNSFFVMSPR